MVMRALSIAATGMSAQQTNLDVIANNLANINTTAFKRGRAEFSDLIYAADRMVGTSGMMNQATVPEGAMIGLGVRTAAVRSVHVQGGTVPTGNQLDIAISGRGWFEVQDPNGSIFYTRAGSFNINENGEITTVDGYIVQPTIVLPLEIGGNATITVSEDGTISYQTDGETEPTVAGRFNLVNFINEAGLEPIGNNLFRETTASGGPAVGAPGEENYGKVLQGRLETSNVDPVKEITDLITAQRSYEMNSKVIQAADEMSSVVSKNLR